MHRSKIGPVPDHNENDEHERKVRSAALREARFAAKVRHYKQLLGQPYKGCCMPCIQAMYVLA